MCGSAKRDDQRRPGLDSLRLLAALLVFLQHSLSASHLDSWIDVAGFRIGRVGTALFFMLAGYLAAGSRRSPGDWFRGRLKSLFPSFWAVTLLGFLIAWLTRSKPFDLRQIICQMSGMGYFTHGERIVNVATWFMSPLLLLYLAILVVRSSGHPRLIQTVLVLICVVAACRQDGHIMAVECHAVTFLAAAMLGSIPHRLQMQAALAAGGILWLLSFVQPEFHYGVAAMFLLAACIGHSRTLSAAGRFSPIAYEWFLVHGICIGLMARLSNRWELVFVGGSVLSLLAATALKRVIRSVQGIRRRATLTVNTVSGDLTAVTSLPAAQSPA